MGDGDKVATTSSRCEGTDGFQPLKAYRRLEAFGTFFQRLEAFGTIRYPNIVFAFFIS